MRRIRNVVVSLVVLFGLVFGTVELVRLANGDFAGRLQAERDVPPGGRGPRPRLRRRLPRRPGGTGLDDQPVREPGAGDAADRPDLQGAGDVDRDDRAGQPLRRRAGLDHLAGPELRRRPVPDRRGRRSPTSVSSDELGDLFAAATPLLNQVNAQQLSTLLGELAQASQGEGRKIAAGIDVRHAAGRPARQDAERADPGARLLRQVHPGDRARGRRPQQPQRRDQRRAAGVQRGGDGLREPDQHADPVLQPAGHAARDVPPRHRDDPAVGRQRVARPAGGAADDRAGHQRRLPLLREDRRGRLGPEQAARRQHVRLLQHVHPLQRRQQPGLQPDCAPDGRHVVPRAAAAGARRGRLRVRLLVPAVDLRHAAVELDRAVDPRRDAGRATPSSTPSPTAGANGAGAAAANQVYGIIGQPDTSKPTTLGAILNQLLGGSS